MTKLAIPKLLRVILLTLLLVLSSGCSYFDSYFEREPRLPDECKSRAYLRVPLEDFLTRRYLSKSPVRLAIVPYSTPANLSAFNTEQPGLGNRIAWQLQAELARSGIIPIVEVLDRQDWPRKKEEFFTGNFGALSRARAAGYDLVLIGYMERMQGLDAISVYSKLIETTSNVTLYYGQVSASVVEGSFQRQGYSWFGTRRPDLLRTNSLVGQMAQCTTFELLLDEPVPE